MATKTPVTPPDQPPIQPRVYPRDQHPISRAAISENALRVLYRLRDAGFRSCLVGGGVRDLLLGREPKDFDVATDAHPDDVRRLFRNCRLIGRRFRLAHVTFGREVIEVATFRAPVGADEVEEGDIELSDDGRILRDNCYGTIEQDAWRRDFTVNALYYDIANYSVLDFTSGVKDLHEGVLRLIGGDPERRLREDPVRMLRAVRFAAKLGLRVAPEVDEAIHRQVRQLESVAPARLFDEVLKLFHSGAAVTCLDELERYGLFAVLFPETAACFADPDSGAALRSFLVEALRNTDARIQDGLGVHPSFLYAALLWAPVQRELERLQADGMDPMLAMQEAGARVMERQLRRVSIPRRFGQVTREIWDLQQRLPRNQGGRALRLVTHPRFRAGYDFLCLRARVGQADAALCQWWTHMQTTDAARQQLLLAPSEEAETASARPRPRRRRRSSKPAA
jgi:poly(A) polymerase